ncbi:Cutinase [Cordyceps fumosorosea ARSEF 2679]|uniref:Cutinase n=1 Tax=Cordyceps fumosorosea (strain ARSEF 2679) TaxID=1081104 RepID=A0A162MZX9_CORFA|nr:Cutinase [Cordyceps fumosorosea ARSEF 2679]OAA73259.1 Cutinase [Cordyceps fumosorosea ARSEF 2679]
MQPLGLLLAALFGTTALAVPTSVDHTYSDLARRDLDTNKFIDAVLDWFPGQMAVQDACTLIGAGETFLGKAFGIVPTANSNGCADVTIVFARGTCDPGNVGVLAGPSFFGAVAQSLGGRTLNVQGVAYPASVSGYLNADKAAGQTMAQIVRDTRKACPSTKIVISGYSQGGLAVHNAADALGGDMSNVSAAVIFGDPMSHQPVSNIDPSNTHIVCHSGDSICDQGAIVLPTHLTYAIDAASSAAWLLPKIS